MPFVKLDCGMLDSTIWIDREAREIFITALLMAEPMGTSEPQEQLRVRNLELTGFVVPPGAYGFVPAAGVGIVRRSGLEQEVGLAALERLGDPEVDSRDPAFEGRRMVRVNRGYLILNYSKFRAHDYTTAERSKRYREKLKLKEINEQNDPSRRDVTASRRDITQAEAEAEADKKKKKRASPSAPFVPPEGLDLTAWDQWMDYRREIKKPLKPVSLAMAAKQMAMLGSRQLEAVEWTKGHGWTGLRLPDRPASPGSERRVVV